MAALSTCCRADAALTWLGHVAAALTHCSTTQLLMMMMMMMVLDDDGGNDNCNDDKEDVYDGNDHVTMLLHLLT